MILLSLLLYYLLRVLQYTSAAQIFLSSRRFNGQPCQDLEVIPTTSDLELLLRTTTTTTAPVTVAAITTTITIRSAVVVVLEVPQERRTQLLYSAAVAAVVSVVAAMLQHLLRPLLPLGDQI